MTTHPTFTVVSRGERCEFTSRFLTDEDAAAALRETAANGTFAWDLLRAFRSGLSPAQRAWLHKLASDAACKADLEKTLVDLSTVRSMLLLAKAAQKRRPRIVLAVEGRQVVLLLNRREELIVCDGRSFPDRVFYGSALGGGRFNPSRHCTLSIGNLLQNLAANPAAVASQHGVATGQCCFCNRLLSTKESRFVGYGPECADKFGLPWGSIA